MKVLFVSEPVDDFRVTFDNTAAKFSPSRVFCPCFQHAIISVPVKVPLIYVGAARHNRITLFLIKNILVFPAKCRLS